MKMSIYDNAEVKMGFGGPAVYIGELETNVNYKIFSFQNLVM